FHEWGNSFDAVHFPLTTDPYGPWALLPKTPRGRKILRGKPRIINPHVAYNIRTTNPTLCVTGLGSSSVPRNRAEAVLAFGSEEEVCNQCGHEKMWPKEVS